MTGRLASFMVGFVFVGVVSCAALSTDRPGCINGHPRPRAPNVHYAGLARCPYYERDHIVPLCLLGADTLDNLQYQPIINAHLKDAREKATCEAYCRGEIDLITAQMQFHREFPAMTPSNCFK